MLEQDMTITAYQPPPLRESQVKAGMVPSKDPKKHLASGCTMLPPPEGEAHVFSLEVTEDSPIRTLQILGLTFTDRVTQPVFKGTARRPRYVPSKILAALAPNQVEALELAAQSKVISGWACRFDEKEEEEWYEVSGPMSQFIRFVPAGPEDRELRILELEQKERALQEKNELLEHELEELRRAIP